MKANVCDLIAILLNYAERKQLIDPPDRVFFRNRLMEELGVASYEPTEAECADMPLEELLGALCD